MDLCYVNLVKLETHFPELPLLRNSGLAWPQEMPSVRSASTVFQHSEGWRGPVAAPARCDWGAGAPRGRGAAGPPQPHLMGLSSRVPVASVQTPQLLASVQLGFRLNILEP